MIFIEIFDYNYILIIQYKTQIIFTRASEMCTLMKIFREVIYKPTVKQSLIQYRLTSQNVSRENPKGISYADVYDVNHNPPPMPKPLEEGTIRGVQIEVADIVLKNIVYYSYARNNLC